MSETSRPIPQDNHTGAPHTDPNSIRFRGKNKELFKKFATITTPTPDQQPDRSYNNQSDNLGIAAEQSPGADKQGIEAKVPERLWPQADSASDRNPPISSTIAAQPQNHIKYRAAFVADKNFADSRARDIAEKTVRQRYEKELEGAGVFKRIWKGIKHTYKFEYDRQQELAAARKKIIETGNVFYDRTADKAAHDAAINSTIDRFLKDVNNERIHTGENKVKMGPEVNKAAAKVIKDFVGGRINDKAAFAEAFKRELKNVPGVDNRLFEYDIVSGNNLFATAEQIKASTQHLDALNNLDKELEIVCGDARMGVRTEANLNTIDKIVNGIKSSRFGAWVDENTIGATVALLYGGFAALGKRLINSKVSAYYSFGGTAVAASLLAGAKENKRLKEERSVHARQRAQGMSFEDTSHNRQEMEKYLHDMKDASAISGEISSIIYTTNPQGQRVLKNQLTPAEGATLLDLVADIKARNQLSDGIRKIDLIRYSDETLIDIERERLDDLQSMAVVLLKQNNASALTMAGGNVSKVDQLIANHALDRVKKLEHDAETGIEARDRAFNKMKFRAVGKKMGFAVLAGVGVGLGVQQGIGWTKDLFHYAQGTPNTRGDTFTEWLFNKTTGKNANLGHAINEGFTTKVGGAGWLESFKAENKPIKFDHFLHNDTLRKSDFNELKLWYGGPNNTGFIGDKKIELDIGHLKQGNSWAGGYKPNIGALRAARELGVAIRLPTGETVVGYANAQGKVVFEGDWVDKVFEKTSGKPKFHAKWMALIGNTEMQGGVQHVDCYASIEGDGKLPGDELPPPPTPPSPDMEYPPFIPVSKRRFMGSAKYNEPSAGDIVTSKQPGEAAGLVVAKKETQPQPDTEPKTDAEKEKAANLLFDKHLNNKVLKGKINDPREVKGFSVKTPEQQLAIAKNWDRLIIYLQKAKFFDEPRRRLNAVPAFSDLVFEKNRLYAGLEVLQTHLPEQIRNTARVHVEGGMPAVKEAVETPAQNAETELDKQIKEKNRLIEDITDNLASGARLELPDSYANHDKIAEQLALLSFLHRLLVASRGKISIAEHNRPKAGANINKITKIEVGNTTEGDKSVLTLSQEELLEAANLKTNDSKGNRYKQLVEGFRNAFDAAISNVPDISETSPSVDSTASVDADADKKAELKTAATEILNNAGFEGAITLPEKIDDKTSQAAEQLAEIVKKRHSKKGEWSILNTEQLPNVKEIHLGDTTKADPDKKIAYISIDDLLRHKDVSKEFSAKKPKSESDALTDEQKKELGKLRFERDKLGFTFEQVIAEAAGKSVEQQEREQLEKLTRDILAKNSKIGKVEFSDKFRAMLLPEKRARFRAIHKRANKFNNENISEPDKSAVFKITL